MKAGCAAADITPWPGMPLSGFAMRRNRPSVAVDDSLHVKVLALEDGEELFLLLSYDLIAFDRALDGSLHEVLRDCLGDRYAFERTVITTTHTHSGPPTLPIAGESRPPAEYIARVGAATRQAALAAVNQLGEARLYHDSIPVDGLTYNRREGYQGPQSYQNSPAPGEQAPGQHDRSLDLFVLQSPGGSPVGAFARFACHGVTMATQHISADFPGELTCRIGARLGVPCLFLQGASGDVNPVVLAQDHAAMLGFVDRLMDQLGNFPDRLRLLPQGGLRAWNGCAAIPFAPLPDRAQVIETIAKNERILAGDTTSADLQPLIKEYQEWRYPSDTDLDAIIRHWAAVYQDAARRRLSVIDAAEPLRPLDCRVVVWELGEVHFVFVAGEILTSVSQRIHSLLPGKSVQVVGFLSPVVGYITGPEEYETGGYEPQVAWFWYQQPGPFAADMQQPLLDEIARLAAQMDAR